MPAFPKNTATPGVMIPGGIWPGNVYPYADPVTTWKFGGYEPLVYIDYIDVNAGHTLTAVPGDRYGIAPAGQGVDYGCPVPPPDGNWS